MNFKNDDSGIYFGKPGGGMSYNPKMITIGTLSTNPNALILGTPGQGKNYSMKKAVLDNVLELKKGEVIYITDPENEYRPLANQIPDQLVIVPPVTQTIGSSKAPGDSICVTNSKESEG